MLNPFPIVFPRVYFRDQETCSVLLKRAIVHSFPNGLTISAPARQHWLNSRQMRTRKKAGSFAPPKLKHMCGLVVVRIHHHTSHSTNGDRATVVTFIHESGCYLTERLFTYLLLHSDRSEMPSSVCERFHNRVDEPKRASLSGVFIWKVPQQRGMPKLWIKWSFSNCDFFQNHFQCRLD